MFVLCFLPCKFVKKLEKVEKREAFGYPMSNESDNHPPPPNTFAVGE